MKPLFLPLKKEYFEAFESGGKPVEYRKYGPRWNERTCVIGRPVVLSCGYGKHRRIMGAITGFAKVHPNQSRGALSYWDCYGVGDPGPIAEIYISVHNN